MIVSKYLLASVAVVGMIGAVSLAGNPPAHAQSPKPSTAVVSTHQPADKETADSGKNDVTDVQNANDTAGAKDVAESASATDTDNIQSGDQTQN